MRLAIDASRITVAKVTGTERYALDLLRHLVPLLGKHEVDLYFRDTPSPNVLPAADNIIYHKIPLRHLWTHIRFANEIFRTRPDMTFVPAHTLPLCFPGAAVVTLHDLGYIHYPEAHPPFSRWYLDWSTRFSAKRATHIIADSIATKGDLINYYNVDEKKIEVIYPGVDKDIQPVKEDTYIVDVERRYHLPQDYLLFVGTLQPRKNIKRIVQAYHRSQIYQTHGIELLLGGAQGWLYDPDWTNNVPGVRELGYIPHHDLATLYTRAFIFIFPTLFEGFGFPVLEAMRCGTPVITSTTSCLPELAGDAALLVNPLAVEEIVDKILKLVHDDPLRLTLVERGYQQAQQFTWAKAAGHTLNVLLRVAEK